jgi:hypothetical protein
MGLERVRIALVRGFDMPRGPMREDALDWVKEQEERRERRQGTLLVAAITPAVGAWIAVGPFSQADSSTNNSPLTATPNGLGTMPNGKSIRRRQDLGSSPTAGRSQDHI